MRLKKILTYMELEGQGRDIINMPTYPGAILLGKMAYPPKQIRR